MSLTGKVIVITGASSGIGATLAKHVASLGASVVLAARRTADLAIVAKDCGDEKNYLIHQCDVSKRSDHESLLAAALAKFGKVTCWVNNAGSALGKKLLELTEDDVDFMISVNTKSVLFGMQTAIPYYKTTGEGTVINISSVLARVPNSSELSMYSASKAAVNSLTVNARVDLQNEGFKNIHVNLFTPGLVESNFGAAAQGTYTHVNSPLRQTAQEVAELITRSIAEPATHTDVYSREMYQQLVVRYFSAPDVKVIEQQPPFASPAFLAAAQKAQGQTGAEPSAVPSSSASEGSVKLPAIAK